MGTKFSLEPKIFDVGGGTGGGANLQEVLLVSLTEQLSDDLKRVHGELKQHQILGFIAQAEASLHFGHEHVQ